MMTVQACRPEEKVLSPITATQFISSKAVAVLRLFDIPTVPSSACQPVSSHGSNVGVAPEPISPSCGKGSGLPPYDGVTLNKLSSSLPPAPWPSW